MGDTTFVVHAGHRAEKHQHAGKPHFADMAKNFFDHVREAGHSVRPSITHEHEAGHLLVMHATGHHHNHGNPHDLNQMALAFVDGVSAAGYPVLHAGFTAGSHEDLHPEAHSPTRAGHYAGHGEGQSRPA